MFKQGDVARTLNGGCDYYIEIMQDQEDPGDDLEAVVIWINAKGIDEDIELDGYYNDFGADAFVKAVDPRISNNLERLEEKITKLIALCSRKEI